MSPLFIRIADITKDREGAQSTGSLRPMHARELMPAEQPEHEEGPSAIAPPLEKLPPSRWRSLGGYLNYAEWPERERFAELDRALKARRDKRTSGVRVVRHALVSARDHAGVSNYAKAS